MLVFQGRQPVCVVGAGVFIVSDPYSRLLQQRDDRGKDLFAWYPVSMEIKLDLLTDGRQGAAKFSQTTELRLFPVVSPSGVIPVLLAPLRVPSSGLKVTARAGANPDIGPGRGNDQSRDTLDHLAVSYAVTVFINVSEYLACPFSGNARFRVA
jgi:hypothetical protein